MVRGACNSTKTFYMGPKARKTCSGLNASIGHNDLVVQTPHWIIRVEGKSVYGRIAGLDNRLDLSFAPRVDEVTLRATGS